MKMTSERMAEIKADMTGPAYPDWACYEDDSEELVSELLAHIEELEGEIAALGVSGGLARWADGLRTRINAATTRAEKAEADAKRLEDEATEASEDSEEYMREAFTISAKLEEVREMAELRALPIPGLISAANVLAVLNRKDNPQ